MSEPNIEEMTDGAAIVLEPGAVTREDITFHTSAGAFIAHPNMYQRKKRTIAEIERDRQFIARLYLEGKNQLEITDALNDERDYDLTSATISREISAILKRWRYSAIKDMETLVARELERLAKLENEYWEAWARSIHDQEVVELYDYEKEAGEGEKEYKRGRGRPSTNLKSKRVIKGTSGDVEFLMGIERCIQLRMRLLGLDKGKTINVNWRKQAEQDGHDPDEIVESLVDSLFKDRVRLEALGDGS